VKVLMVHGNIRKLRKRDNVFGFGWVFCSCVTCS